MSDDWQRGGGAGGWGGGGRSWGGGSGVGAGSIRARWNLVFLIETDEGIRHRQFNPQGADT